MTDATEEKTVALFIDADNIIRPLDQRLERLNLEAIVRRAREYGMMILARAYGDWGFFPCRDYIRDFSTLGIEMTQLHSDIKGKNTADMQMSIDALEHCFSDFSAGVFVLVSGDRDFVPLVQVLRRHGKEVVCLCVDEAASATLKNICDVYISYDSLLAKSPAAEAVAEATATAEKAGPAVVDERLQAFQTMVDAIVAIKRRGQPVIGGHVNQMMRQLLPSFDFIALGYRSFKEFVEDAQARGIIRAEHSGVGDFVLDVVDKAEGAPIPAPAPKYDYSTVEDALQSYRTILERKRVPLVPWIYREPLVRQLWKQLTAHGDVGMSGWEMVDLLLAHSKAQNWRIAQDEAVKLIYTLNIAYCFKVENVATRSPDILNTKATAAVEVDKALELMHLVYLRGMRFEDPDVRFLPEAVAHLLFDNRSPVAINNANALIYELLEWR